MRRIVWTAAGMIAALGLAGVFAGTAAADTVMVSFTTPGCQPWTVPPGVTTVQVEAVGAAGNVGGRTGRGGLGDGMAATLAGLTPGEPLRVCAAAGGGPGGGGQVGGGGWGGGASGVARGTDFSNPLLIAGGGGGGGVFALGGDAGLPVGGDGEGWIGALFGGNGGGKGGNNLAGQGGAGGTGGSDPGTAGAGFTPAGPGAGGRGGTLPIGLGGGGGGGGYYGGGGGAGGHLGNGNGGGGGGTSFCAPDLTCDRTAGAGTSNSAGAAPGEAKVVLTYDADTTPPAASPTASPAANAAGWNATDVTVAWNWTDAGGSGIDAGNCTTSTTSAGEGELTLNATCTDNAGNTGEASYTVKVDKTKPTISAAATTSPNGNGWYNADVAVAFTCSDGGGSGIAGACPANEILSSEGASVSSTAQTVQDVAGNTSDPSNVVTVKIDKTDPVVTISGGGTYGVLDMVNVTCVAGDALAGLDTDPCASALEHGPASSYGPGSQSVSVTATDLAGNSTTESVEFSVSATYADLCTLTEQFSSKKNENDLCNLLKEAEKADAKGNAKQKQHKLDEYVRKVADDSTRKNPKDNAFTVDEAATLIAFAQSL